nr:helix-turn-helix domain-containing protein [Streptomyces kaniharaensis]
MRRMYLAGAPVREIAESYGTSYGFVHRVLSREGVTFRPNASDLSCVPLGDRDGGRLGRWPVAVLGAFEGPVGHLAFDDVGAGPVAAFGQQAFGDLSQGAGECPGESAGGKVPPGRVPGGVQPAGCG